MVKQANSQVSLKWCRKLNENIFFPSISNVFHKCAKECQNFVLGKPIDNSQKSTELNTIIEWALGPEGFMHVDLPATKNRTNWRLPKHHHSNWCFLKIRICKPGTTFITAKVIVDILTRHAYLSTVITTDKGQVFVSSEIHEVADVLDNTLRHATAKLTENTRVLGGTHGTIKTSLKMSSRVIREQRHKFLQQAVLNYNTTYPTKIGCENCRIFNGRFPYNILDHKFALKLKSNLVPTENFADELLIKTQLMYDKIKKIVMHHTSDILKHYDKEIKASRFQQKYYCYILQPEAEHHASKKTFRDVR